MTEEFFVIEEGEAPAEAAFIGFDDDGPAVPSGSSEQRELPIRTTRRAGRAAAPRRRPHFVRLRFDDREFLRLNRRATAAGISLADFIRARVLREPRRQDRHATPSNQDLFAAPEDLRPAKVETAVRLPAELEERIDAYFAGEGRFTVDPQRRRATTRPLPARAMVLARLRDFVAEHIGGRRRPQWRAAERRS